MRQQNNIMADQVPFDDYIDIEEVYEIEDYVGSDVDEFDTGQELSEVIDLSKLSFNKHTKSVFCCDISKDGSLAITGGEDDVAYLWSTISGDTILECTGHTDSVTEVHFNHNGQLVVTGDMAGLIQVWSIAEKKLIWCDQGDDMEWTRWHPSSNALCSGSQSGNVTIWQIPQGNCKVLPSHGFPATCATIVPSNEKLITVAYSDGQLKLWDIRSASVIWQLDQPLSNSITSLDIHGNVIVTAPSGHLIKLTDGKTIGALSSDGTIECVAFQPNLALLITGSLSGHLHVFDLLRNYSPRHTAQIDGAVTQICVDRANIGRVLVAATGGAICEFDIRAGVLVRTWTGHVMDVLSVRIDNAGKVMLSTSDDCTGKVWQLGAF